MIHRARLSVGFILCALVCSACGDYWQFQVRSLTAQRSPDNYVQLTAVVDCFEEYGTQCASSLCFDATWAYGSVSDGGFATPEQRVDGGAGDSGAASDSAPIDHVTTCFGDKLGNDQAAPFQVTSDHAIPASSGDIYIELRVAAENPNSGGQLIEAPTTIASP